MLNVGRIRADSCSGVSRRSLLQVGALGAVGITLADLLRCEAAGAVKDAPARSVILLWLWGGPSHLDTFDLKPGAPLEYRGPYAPVATSAPGVEICELLPQLARRADRYALIRSLHHTSSDHGIAGTIGLTGSDAGGRSLGGKLLPGTRRATHGAVVAKVLGPGEAVPHFVTLGGRLHQGKKQITGEDAARLGPIYDPFRLDYDPEQGVKIPQLQLLDGLTPDGLSSRRQLLENIDRLRRRVDDSAMIQRLERHYRQAFSLLTSGAAREVFDLDREPEKLRTRYGRFRFGQCCLMARRLVEAGARFVQVNWSSHVEPVEDTGDGGWDMHDRNFQQLQDRHTWMLDQAVSALLDDLAGRGLLDETVVVAVGEFGRTPKINVKSGRDHWNQCYSALIAGGGTRGGQVVGSSDARAENPLTRAVTPADLFATVLRKIGLGTTQLTAAGIAPQGEVMEELL